MRILAAFVFAVAAWPAQAEHLSLVTEDGAPFNMESEQNGGVTGMSTDLLGMAFKELGVEYDIAVYPWARAYKMAMNKADTCVYSTTLTPDREPHFRWVGPLYTNDWVLITRTNSPPVRSLADVRGHPIGGYYSNASSDYLRAHGFVVEASTSDLLNAKKLLAGRIDYWVLGGARARYFIRTNAIAGVRIRFKFAETKLYMACNPSVSPDLIARLNAVLGRLRADGVADAIAARYQ